MADNLKLAKYWVKKDKGSVQCHLCPNNCVIADGKYGSCKARKNIAGKLYSMVYGKPCSAAVDPIEKKPQYHFLPGSLAFSIGTPGCNMHCKFCQNFEISQASPEEIPSTTMMPEDVVKNAIKSGSKSVAYTYNEPTIFYEYVEDCAKLAHKAGLKNIFVTNGYINEKPLKDILPLIDGFHVDLKGFREDYYKNICFAKLQPVLNTLKILRKNKKWFEIINLIVPTLNDDIKVIKEMCSWIKKELGPETVVHFSRFYPCYKLSNLFPTPIETLTKAADIAKKVGLKFVYIGNVPEEDNTICPKCKKTVIRRFAFDILENNVVKGKCKFCKQKIPGVWE